MIELINLQKIIANQTLVDIPELRVANGEVAGLVGPAGSGNEVLLSLLTGRSRPTLGTVSIAGIDPTVQRDTFGQRVGVLFAEDGLYERQSARSNLAFYSHLHGLEADTPDYILRKVGLADQGNESVTKLSGSLKRRLAFGRSLLHQPQALILVEPFNRCDVDSIIILSTLIRSTAESGASVLILTSDHSHLVDVCDVIYRLENGHIVDSTRPKEVHAETIPFKIPVRLEGKVVLVNPVDILYADASDGKATLYTADGPLLTPFTLTELETRLLRSGFFRAHRSYLVNLQHVKEVIPYTRNSFSLRLNDPKATVIPLSKQAAGELKDLLGF